MTNLIEVIPKIFVTTANDTWTGRFDNITEWERPINSLITVSIKVTKEKEAFSSREIFFATIIDSSEEYERKLHETHNHCLEDACKILLLDVLDNGDYRELLDIFCWRFIQENH